MIEPLSTPIQGRAAAALDHYDDVGYTGEDPPFVAIFFRNLLLLGTTTGDSLLAQRVIATVRRYVDEAWARNRSDDDLFHFPPAAIATTLLNQAAMVSAATLLAADAADDLLL